MNTNPKTDYVIALDDGRKLGYAEYGDPAGQPIFYFHGWPSSRLEGENFHRAGQKLGARIISPDRPGLGLSDFKKGFIINHWPDDVLALAEALQIERFAVVGISSGAPYAFACARFIPDRLTAAGSVSGVGPLDGPNPGQYLIKQELMITRLARRTPRLARLLLHLETRKLKRNPAKALTDMDKSLPDVDKAIFRDRPDLAAVYTQTVQECVRQGMRGPIASIALEGQAWGFQLEDIRLKFRVWQGELDNLVFPVTAHYLARRLPHCELTLYPNEGHISTIVNRAEEIVGALIVK
ncbi:MAG: alpha/beta hydrolase [Anaerolineales bacterium]|nr:alpha/beta hydrolase [Anaerolineales bacterium]